MSKEKGDIRIGKISSIDYAKGVARVTLEDKGGSTTAEFSFIADRYQMPRVGDQVITAHQSNDTAAGVIIGPVWHDGRRPPEGYEHLYRKDLAREPGKAIQRYDAKAEEYNEYWTGKAETEATEEYKVVVSPCTITVSKDGTITIEAPAGIKINTPLIEVTGDVIADGKKVSLAHHTHPGDSGGTTGEPN